MNKLATAVERIERTLGQEWRNDSNWNEGDHPRAPNGQFGSGDGGAAKSGGGEAPKSSAPAKSDNPVHSKIDADYKRWRSMSKDQLVKEHQSFSRLSVGHLSSESKGDLINSLLNKRYSRKDLDTWNP